MSNFTCPDFDTLQSCAINPSYLRPENGATIIPWLYSAILLTLHIPLAFLRVVKWKQSQWFSLALAFFTISLASLSYVSTSMSAETIYVWLPVALTADISSSMQLIILIEKDPSYRHYQGRKIASSVKWIRHCQSLFWKTVRSVARFLTNFGNRQTVYREVDVELQRQAHDWGHLDPPSLPPIVVESDPYWPSQDDSFSSHMHYGSSQLLPDEVDQNSSQNPSLQLTNVDNRSLLSQRSNRPQPRGAQDVIMPATLLVTFGLSIVVFTILLSLQIIGLIFAGLRYFHHEPLVASWCSPAFDNGGEAFILTPECQVFSITPTHGGTGCIDIPGDQASWLLWTFIALCVEIALQIVDACLMILAKRWRRPWCTMSAGVIVWTTLVGIGIQRAQLLPIPKNTVAVVFPQGNISCLTDLYPGGLRGSIVAWSDGVFQGLHTAYFGPAGD